jgi:hypothetical protein
LHHFESYWDTVLDILNRVFSRAAPAIVLLLLPAACWAYVHTQETIKANELDVATFHDRERERRNFWQIYFLCAVSATAAAAAAAATSKCTRKHVLVVLVV